MAFSSVARRATCQSGGAEIGGYNQSLRIGAVFIILAVSSIACGFPIMAARCPGMRMPADFFFTVRHFGTGVLIATAFVHLLPTAFTLLGDPCLSDFWTEKYQAMPGAIALAGIFIVTVVEMLLHPARSMPPESTRAESPVINARRPLQGREGSISRSLSNIGERPQFRATHGDEESKQGNRGADTSGWMSRASTLTPEQKHRKEIMHCLLLEMGILFHSVFIGMALSVTIGGSEFVILLIAITFHQTFEGLALGARIAAIDWPRRSLRPLFMALAYGCTTPLGQAIGLAARSAYSPDSEVGLILVGVMNAISAGLLLFASLIELLSEDLLTDESWRVLRGKRRVCAFLLVVAGAFGMSLVGAWA
ncbi:Zinc/iron permease [Xylariaceae sp. FL0662B]|nr:Zinc/iron permease [Xylariaceae sp. FL0662B]